MISNQKIHFQVKFIQFKIFCLKWKVDKNQDIYDKLCNFPMNEHPGDDYFAKVLEIQRRKRTTFMNNHSSGQKFQIAMSWLKFFKDDFYFYNFYYDKSEPQIPKLYDEYIKFIRKVFKKK